jgi:putative nucleotidyltransferase with HDIG domain
MIGVAAIVPAAGLSSRMGQVKSLLPLRDGTVLSCSIESFRGSVDRIIVVTGKYREKISEEARRCGAEVVHNERYEEDMFLSIRTGVRALRQDTSAFFILPADIPLVRPETVSQLLDEYAKTEPSVLLPRFLGESGHPPLISRELIPEILSHDGTGGLRSVLDRYGAKSRWLDVADIGTVHDLDLPEDYARALWLVDKVGPIESECRQLWDMYNVSDHIVGHCRAVATVAEALCSRINELNEKAALNPVLVKGAALTHDIGKGTRQHEKVGAEMLRKAGFHAAAEIVEDHFDLPPGPVEAITEKEIVFLADKLVRCHGPVRLEERYLEKLEMYRHEEGAEQAILGRLGRARELYQLCERAMTVSPEAVAREALA